MSRRGANLLYWVGGAVTLLGVAILYLAERSRPSTNTDHPDGAGSRVESDESDARTSEQDSDWSERVEPAAVTVGWLMLFGLAAPVVLSNFANWSFLAEVVDAIAAVLPGVSPAEATVSPSVYMSSAALSVTFGFVWGTRTVVGGPVDISPRAVGVFLAAAAAAVLVGPFALYGLIAVLPVFSPEILTDVGLGPADLVRNAFVLAYATLYALVTEVTVGNLQ